MVEIDKINSSLINNIQILRETHDLPWPMAGKGVHESDPKIWIFENFKSLKMWFVSDPEN